MRKRIYTSAILVLLIAQSASAQYKGGTGDGHGMASAGTSSNTLPLPVELINFTAQLKDSVVMLEWSTASETNNDGFIVEKSIDGEVFIAIGTVSGAGNATHQLDYIFYDTNPTRGLSYYQLKQVDFNGTFTYSDVRRVVNHIKPKTLTSIYPNPCNNELHVVGENLEDLRVYTAEGKELTGYKSNVNAAKSAALFNLSALPSGLYWLRSNRVSFRFVKM
jgi:hypothetical protein